MSKMTEMQLKMYRAQGHKVKVRIKGMEKVFIGECTWFTQPLDNEPEIASINVEVTEPEEVLYELFEPEIQSIELLD